MPCYARLKKKGIIAQRKRKKEGKFFSAFGWRRRKQRETAADHFCFANPREKKRKKKGGRTATAEKRFPNQVTNLLCFPPTGGKGGGRHGH